MLAGVLAGHLKIIEMGKGHTLPKLFKTEDVGTGDDYH